ncbi:IS200/IS605 family transposase [Paenibacillus thiaminolyticus]|uniref:IS200/IS605 family transposase n=1 Tax=Paenibacillus thiaminolyticus TaxID=49283 RepID=UPI003D294417
MELDNNNHSVFLLYYHLVLVVKYRRKVIDDTVGWNHDLDHVHILFKAHPNTELSNFITAYKIACSRLIKKHYPQVKRMLCKEYFWSRSFCLLTIGGSPIEVIKKYTESQGIK